MLYEVITVLMRAEPTSLTVPSPPTATTTSYLPAACLLNSFACPLYSVVITSYSIHYTKLYDERFLNVPTSQANNVTTGRIYQNVINKERRGDYLGKTVQIIPHITDEIKRNIKLLGSKNKYDFVITEIGGTVGDIESLPYVEAVRQMKWELGHHALSYNFV